MHLLYWLAIQLYYLTLWVLMPVNARARTFVRERSGSTKRLVSELSSRKPGPLVWVHVASVGEFEQAKPIMERLQSGANRPQILLTFFSPSGFFVGRDYPLADYVHYLPKDTPTNASKLVMAVRPDVVVFIKYDLWYYILSALHQQKVPMYVACAHFRPNQLYFGLARRFWMRVLGSITHFFVQDESTADLLRSYQINQVSVAGDTRYDRVSAVVSGNKELPKIKTFAQGEPLVVLGSVWPSDMSVWEPVILSNLHKAKWLIVPHQLDYAGKLLSLPESVRYSGEIGDSRVLILDTMGMLAAAYRYATIAYVGGAFRGAVHNVLEPAAHGAPVLIGRHQKNKKFIEVGQLIAAGGGKDFRTTVALEELLLELLDHPTKRNEMGAAAGNQVRQRIGATELIVRELKKWI